MGKKANTEGKIHAIWSKRSGCGIIGMLEYSFFFLNYTMLLSSSKSKHSCALHTRTCCKENGMVLYRTPALDGSALDFF